MSLVVGLSTVVLRLTDLITAPVPQLSPEELRFAEAEASATLKAGVVTGVVLYLCMCCDRTQSI